MLDKETLVAAIEAVRPKTIDVPGIGPVLVTPDNYQVHDLDHLQEAPRRLQQTVNLHDAGEFVEFVNRFKKISSTIFVVPELTLGPRACLMATCVIDYHADLDAPNWGGFRVNLLAAPSQEYRLLNGIISAGLTDQATFAKNLRDVASLCHSHSAGELLEIVRTMQLSSKGDFKSFEDDLSGSVDFRYDLKVSASAGTTEKKLSVPEELRFYLPVLVGGSAVGITTRLLYRIPKESGGQVSLGLEMPDRVWIEKAAVDHTAKLIGEQTELMTVIGSIS